MCCKIWWVLSLSSVLLSKDFYILTVRVPLTCLSVVVRPLFFQVLQVFYTVLLIHIVTLKFCNILHAVHLWGLLRVKRLQKSSSLSSKKIYFGLFCNRHLFLNFPPSKVLGRIAAKYKYFISTKNRRCIYKLYSRLTITVERQVNVIILEWLLSLLFCITNYIPYVYQVQLIVAATFH